MNEEILAKLERGEVLSESEQAALFSFMKIEPEKIKVESKEQYLALLQKLSHSLNDLNTGLQVALHDSK